MDKNIVDNSYSYFTFVCGNVLFYRDASFHGGLLNWLLVKILQK